MSDFNKILYQQCNIELQTNRKIAVKSVNNCNSYSDFSAGSCGLFLLHIHSELNVCNFVRMCSDLLFLSYVV